MTDHTLLLRQIHPSFVQQGRVTSQAFRPTSKDQRQLSVYDGDQITPENSWNHFTGKLCYAWAGTQGFTIGECRVESLPACSDPVPFPEHVLVNFSAFSENQVEKKSKKLRNFAENRGWLFQPANG